MTEERHTHSNIHGWQEEVLTGRGNRRHRNSGRSFLLQASSSDQTYYRQVLKCEVRPADTKVTHMKGEVVHPEKTPLRGKGTARCSCA
jgi:hypothetical protein